MRVIRVAEDERVVDVEPVEALDEEELDESDEGLVSSEEAEAEIVEEGPPEPEGEDEAPSDDE